MTVCYVPLSVLILMTRFDDCMSLPRPNGVDERTVAHELQCLTMGIWVVNNVEMHCVYTE